MRPRSGSFYADTTTTLDPLNQLTVSQKAAISSGLSLLGGRRKKHHVRSDSGDADDESAPLPLPVAIAPLTASNFKRSVTTPIRIKYAPVHGSPLRYQVPGSTKLKPSHPRCYSDTYLMGGYSGLTFKDLDVQMSPISFRSTPSSSSPIVKKAHSHYHPPPNRTLLRCVLRNRWIASSNADLARRYGLRNAWQMEEDVKLALGHVKKYPIPLSASSWINTTGDEWAASTLCDGNDEGEIPISWGELIFGEYEECEESSSSSGSDGAVSAFDSDSDEEVDVRVSQWQSI